MVCNMVLGNSLYTLFSATSHHLLKGSERRFSNIRGFPISFRRFSQFKKWDQIAPVWKVVRCNAKSSSYQHFYGKLLLLESTTTSARRKFLLTHIPMVLLSHFLSPERNGEAAKNSLDIFTPRPKEKIFRFHYFTFKEVLLS